MADKLRVCVIGMGPIGNRHADIYKEDELAELIGVCDIIPEKAEDAGERLQVPFFTDAEEMLDSLEPDVCSITTGGYEYGSDHYEPTMQALNAGVHVLCEKPISNEIKPAEEMVALAKEKNLCFGIDFNHRFTPAAFLADKWFENGDLGELLFINMALWIGKPQDPESPYFHLKALNPHSVDIMQHFGGDIKQVQCFALKANGRSIWSSASINMKFESGIIGHLTSSYDLARGHPMERCEVAGVDGRFVLKDMWREVVFYPANDMEKRVYTNPVFGEKHYKGFKDTFRKRIHCFVKQVAEGASPEEINGSGEDGLKAQKVIAAAIKSLNMGNKLVDVE